jgi:hypothetical protein
MSDSPITGTMVEAAARSDATFDGRDFDKLGRADRERYLARARLSVAAAEQAAWRPIEEAPRDGTRIMVAPSFWSGRTFDIAQFDTDRFAKKPRPFWYRDRPATITACRATPPVLFRLFPASPASCVSVEASEVVEVQG